MSNIQKSDKKNIITLINKGAHLELGKPFQREILLIKTYIAGTSYVENIDDIEEGIVKGTKLALFRETNNKHDKLAILIKDEKGNKLGYIPRGNNEILARLMDAGKLIYAVVKDKGYVEGWLKVEINVYMRD